jgi:hypothetical protein
MKSDTIKEDFNHRRIRPYSIKNFSENDLSTFQFIVYIEIFCTSNYPNVKQI